MTDTKSRAQLQYEALFTQTNDHMVELIGNQRLEGERFNQFANLYFIGQMLRFNTKYPYKEVNVSEFLKFFDESFHAIIAFVNDNTVNSVIINEEELKRYTSVLRKYMKRPNTENFWLLNGDKFHIAEPWISQSFDSAGLTILLESILEPEREIDDIPGDSTIFSFLDERDLSIYKEIYPNLFN